MASDIFISKNKGIPDAATSTGQDFLRQTLEVNHKKAPKKARHDSIDTNSWQ